MARTDANWIFHQTKRYFVVPLRWSHFCLSSAYAYDGEFGEKNRTRFSGSTANRNTIPGSTIGRFHAATAIAFRCADTGRIRSESSSGSGIARAGNFGESVREAI